jgi:hypothetical protein
VLIILFILLCKIVYYCIRLKFTKEEDFSMKKLLLVTALTAFTILSGTSAFAQEVPRVKRDVRHGVYNQSAQGNSRTNTYQTKVDIPEHFGHGKLYVTNHGSTALTVNMERASDNKDTALQGHISGDSATVRVAPGTSKTIYTETPTGTGEHRIQVNSSNSTLDATISYKYSDNANHLRQ